MFQYRITINGSQQPIEGYPGEKWSRIADYIEQRGGIATLERRFVTDLSFLEYQPDNIMILRDKVVTYWTVVAEVEF